MQGVDEIDMWLKLKLNKNMDDRIEFDLEKVEYEIIDGKLIVKEKEKKIEYPKTYKECCDVLNLAWNKCFVMFDIDYNGLTDEENNLYESLIKLKRCRDAYWKIAGEEMGLGKPWEPDLENEELYCIQNYNKQIIKSKTNTAFNKILIFPTEEMRDVFYENFKDLIELCKELL